MPASAPVSGSVAATLVVVNYNGRRHLPGLLDCLARQTVQDFALIVVDNGSTDGSREILAQAAAGSRAITVIRNARNLGFAPACNQGIRAACSAGGESGEWIGMLNNDTRPAPDFLEQMLAMATWRPEIGMVGAKLLRAACPSQIDSAGIAIDCAGIAWDWRGGQIDDPHEAGPVEIFGPCGGAALYARRMLEEVGGFDDDFFAYLEDVDLAWRARLAGWQAYLQPRARALHAHSATLGDASPLKRYLLARNKVWLLAKDYPDADLARDWPAVIGYDALAATWGALRRRDLASVRGRLVGLRTLGPWLAKRRALHTRWQDVDNWRRLLAPLEPPWAIPRRYAHLDQAPSGVA